MYMYMYMCMLYMYACYVNNATRYGVRGHGLHTLGRTAEPEPM